MSKGARNEREARHLFNEAGFDTWSHVGGHRRTIEQGGKDVFGLFDLLALRPGELWMVQVKTNVARGIIEWFECAKKHYSVPGIKIAFMVRHDREGWRMAMPVRLPDEGGIEYQWVIDERDMDCNIGEGVIAWLVESGQD